MNKTSLKLLIIVSLILGIILGILAPIPYIGMIMLIILLLFAAPIVIIFLIMAGKLNLTSVTDSIITGSVIGFATNLTFCWNYTLIIFLLYTFAKYTPNFFLSAMITNSPAWLLLTFIIFIGILCAVTNAFTGFATYYIIEFIRDTYEKKHPEYINKQEKE